METKKINSVDERERKVLNVHVCGVFLTEGMRRTIEGCVCVQDARSLLEVRATEFTANTGCRADTTHRTWTMQFVDGSIMGVHRSLRCSNGEFAILLIASLMPRRRLEKRNVGALRNCASPESPPWYCRVRSRLGALRKAGRPPARKRSAAQERRGWSR